MQMRVETHVNAPPERVYQFATAIHQWPEFITAIERVELLTPGPLAVGTKFRETRRMYGREATEEMTVAELSPPSRFVLTAENHGARYRAEHIIAAVNGGTRLTLTFAGEPVSLVARLMMPLAWLMRGSVEKQLSSDLADLKRAAEAAKT